MELSLLLFNIKWFFQFTIISSNIEICSQILNCQIRARLKAKLGVEAIARVRFAQCR